MESLWKESEVEKFGNVLLKLRVYTSRLLGQNPNLVLHGGGNTSVKTKEVNVFGEEEDIIYIKGSGWDLATIEEAGFAPVRLNSLIKMAGLDDLSDLEMVKYQRMAMTDPSAPNPSVEAILHAIIPHTFVDHTHADSVVTISNTPDGEKRIKDIYGEEMLVIPYIMPGFQLAKEIFKITQNLDWDSINGIILLNHGVFTFHNDPRKSYEKMIEIVSLAEDYLKSHVTPMERRGDSISIDFSKIAQLRKQVSDVRTKPVLATLNTSPKSTTFSSLPNLEKLCLQGPLTPDHIIRTKRIPMIIGGESEVDQFVNDYKSYFKQYRNEDQIQLDPAPRWAIWPSVGIMSFDTSVKNNQVIHDIASHTIEAIYNAEQLGGWKALGKEELFLMEYWELEQAKLKNQSGSKPLQGKIALVTGAASGIGKACVEKLADHGAAVAAIDINPAIVEIFSVNEILGIICDVTKPDQVKLAIEKTITQFGGLDMLISNAGIFPESYEIENMDQEIWNQSIEINLTQHQQLIQYCAPFLTIGIDPSVVIIGSKNVAAPGIAASAYSVAKAGLTQLGRIAALELGKKGIRVNMLHPNAVFDTGIWNDEILKTRAANYGMTVEEYKKNNVLNSEVSSEDVAQMAVTMLGPTFSKTTGAQIPVDGGNDRII